MSDYYGTKFKVVHGIEIKEHREDRPEFKRTYITTVGDGFRIEVSLRTWAYGRMDSSMLYQKNGKWISFEVKAVADKIIDRELYPLVQSAVDEILRLDKEYMDSKPSEFTDDTGSIWRRGR